MAVAWVGQIRFAMTVMHWALPAAVVFAAGFELSTAYAARLDWLSRAKGDPALLFRAATWGFAAGAAVMNYWHAAGPNFAPTGEAVSYGLMSLTGIVLWELLSTYRHRASLRAEGKLPAARPRYGLARWIWFRPLTRLAWLLALRDSYPTTDLAWRAAIGAINLYGSPRAARKAIRAGRPVPRPKLTEDHKDRDDDGTGERDKPRHDERNSQSDHVERDITEQPANRDATSAGQRDNEPESPEPSRQHHQGDQPKRDILAVRPATPRDNLNANQTRSVHNGHQVTSNRGRTSSATPRAGRRAKRLSDALIAKMKTYAQQRANEGTPVTGAELDREFGTHDYGRKVLRQLAADVPVNGSRQP